MKRTVYRDKDEIYSALLADRDSALSSARREGLPRYKRCYWTGKGEGLEQAANLIRDWDGEHAPEPGEAAAPAGSVICQHCGRPIHPVRDGLMWEDDYRQMVCPGIIHVGPHEPRVTEQSTKGTHQ